MSIAEQGIQEGEEAIIISGPRKGQIITLPSSHLELTPEEETMLNFAVDAAKQMAESATRLTERMQALLDDVHEMRARRDESA